MYCRNCGNALGEGQSFCPACGTKRIEENNTQVVNNAPVVNNQEPVVTNTAQVMNNNTQVVNNTTPVVNNVAPAVNNVTPVINNTAPVVNNAVPNYNQINNTKPTQEKKKVNPIIIIVIVIGVFIALAAFFVGSIFLVISDSSNKLECTSPEGNITIMYNEEEILGYTATKMTYDLDQQKEYAKQVGVEAYLEEFNDWFEKNTTGTCTRNGAQGSQNTHDNEKTTETGTKTEEGTVIGDKKYGYITVPNNWVKFHDVDGTTSLQYSYAGVYIVSMDYIREDTTHTVKEYAQSYMYQKKNDPTVSGVTGSTVKIGKNKEYTAYQVYMYYPSDGTYLVTYWFKTEDEVVRYLALEGPAELSGTKITDYTYIPESFSLNK